MKGRMAARALRGNGLDCGMWGAHDGRFLRWRIERRVRRIIRLTRGGRIGYIGFYRLMLHGNLPDKCGGAVRRATINGWYVCAPWRRAPHPSGAAWRP